MSDERCPECGSWERSCNSPAPVADCGCQRCLRARLDIQTKDCLAAIEEYRALRAEVERLREAKEWWTAVNAELLPYQERAIKAEAEMERLREDANLCGELTDALAALRERHAAALEALAAFVDWFGGVHDSDCPLDDTCDCSGKPMNDKVNAVLRDWQARKGVTP